MYKQTITNIYLNSINKYGSNILFRTPQKKNWTYELVNQQTNKFKYLFEKYGLKNNDRIIYLGNNSPNWFSANMASYQMNGIFVPIYESQHLDVTNYIIKETNPKIIINSTNTDIKIDSNLLKEIKPHILNLNKINFENLPELENINTNINNSTNIILYTSGTTGLAKGVCLHHENLCSNIESIDRMIGLNFVNKNDRYFNFLPWSHIYGLNCELYYAMSKGASIFINDDISKISKNLKKSKPTIICSVPKLLYSIYDKIHSNKFLKLIRIKPFDNFTNNLIKRQIFGKNLRFINSGGAAISPNVINFYSELGVKIYQGYGLSETSPMVSLNYESNNKIGSVGKILDCNDVKIVDEEIYVKGSNVFSGYYDKPIETSNAFDSDGYFKTGDQGYIDEEGYLFISGRTKELYKLLNGKYINPVFIENILLESKHIQQIFVYGDSRPYNIALVVSNSNVQTVLSEIKKLSPKLKKYEIPEKILIVEPFTFSDKLLTAKLSLIRKNILAKYKNQIEKLYI